MTELMVSGKIYRPNFPMQEVLEFIDHNPDRIYKVFYFDDGGEVRESWITEAAMYDVTQVHGEIILDIVPLLEEV